MGTNKILFYKIDKNYLDYLRKYDCKVPEIEKTGLNPKPYCGVILEINDIMYFVPVSSFNKKQITNFVIKDSSNNKSIASLRFSFMIPITKINFPKIFTYVDFELIEDRKYADLLEKEYRYCKENQKDIIDSAHDIYDKVVNGNEFFCKICCDFSLLEKKAKIYD